MYTYTILTPTEFKIENKDKNFTMNYIGDKNLAIAETDKFNARELAENKQAKIKALQDKYQAEYDAYLTQYPASEIATFNDKKKEALAYNLDATVATPIIDNILLGYGTITTKSDYVASILAKVNYLAQKEGTMVAVRDAIKACTTQAELDAIVI